MVHQMNTIIFILLIWGIVGLIFFIPNAYSNIKFITDIKNPYKQVIAIILGIIIFGPFVVATVIIGFSLIGIIDNIIFPICDFIGDQIVTPIKQWLYQ